MSDQNMLMRLWHITHGCRPDMHEPGEQELKAWVVGNHLDNACGDNVTVEAITKGYQEYVVILERLVDGKIKNERFNLASLIALARRATFEPALAVWKPIDTAPSREGSTILLGQFSKVDDEDDPHGAELMWSATGHWFLGKWMTTCGHLGGFVGSNTWVELKQTATHWAPMPK